MRRITIIIAAFVMVLIGTAGPASAHADLRATTPASGAVLKEPPSQVTMTFTERVEITASSVQVFDADGTRADGGGRARHLAGRPAVVVLDLPDGLARGGYVVTWRVVSTDAHPIHGAFTFTVGTSPADVDGLARRLVDTGGTDAEVGFNYGVARALTFGGFLVLVGALAFGLLVGGAASVRRAQVAGAAACAVGTLAALPLHALAGAGLGLGRIGDAPVRSALLDGRYGQAAMVRLALLAVVAVLVALPVAVRRVPALVAGVLGAGLAGTFAASGHAVTGRWVVLALVVDVVHLVAAAVWVGGLVALVVHVADVVDDEQRRAAAARFSRVAAVAVTVVVVTGTIQSFRQVGEIDALTSTRYGHLLAVKVAIVTAMLVAAFWSRRWARAASDRSIPRSLAIETVGAVLVVAVTAALMNAPPGRTALAKPFAGELTMTRALVDVTIEPARAGLNDVHVYLLTPEGQVRDAPEVTARLSLASDGIGPLTVPLRRAAPGHFSAYGLSVPLAGRWALDVTVRFTDVDQETKRTFVTFR